MYQPHSLRVLVSVFLPDPHLFLHICGACLPASGLCYPRSPAGTPAHCLPPARCSLAEAPCDQLMALPCIRPPAHHRQVSELSFLQQQTFVRLISFQ
ncbi:mCG1042896 [Mus musculus]|nr:mCG1042896 [Mus musculus]